MPGDWSTSSYFYELPQELIAHQGMEPRDHSRLLVYEQKTDRLTHRYFYDLPSLLGKGDLMIFNQSKVFRARVLGNKKSGGKAEIFFLSQSPTADKSIYSVLIKTRSSKSVGDQFLLPESVEAEIVGVGEQSTFLLRISLSPEELPDYLERVGMVPLPPYIKTEADTTERYQTVYAQGAGSVAAPTAGMHFMPRTFEHLKDKGVDWSFLTLHVGLGTFKNIEVEDLREHRMHEEEFTISTETQKKILTRPKNLLAVGTTSLRALESCCSPQGFSFSDPWPKKTRIFLHPGKKVHSIQGLITNFHLPQSSLLMLVSSLLGREKTLEIYQKAIEEKYRFFSFGDAMLILLDSYEF